MWWIIGVLVFCWIVAWGLCQAASDCDRTNETMDDNSKVGMWRLQH
jgi:hypothetical protein